MYTEGRKQVIYLLDDGTKVTSLSVAKRAKIAHNTAWNRLQKFTDPAKVYAEKMDVSGNKEYQLSDGSKWTSAMLADKMGMKRATACARLLAHTDVAKVFAPLRDGSQTVTDAVLANYMSNRMTNDTTGFWKIFNKLV